MFAKYLSICAVLGALLFASSCDRKEESVAPKMQKEVEVIEGKSKMYIDAVNARDLDTIVDQWSERAVYKNPYTEELVNGRKGIRSEFKKIFSNNNQAKIHVDEKTIRFPIEEKAVEEGVATIIVPGKNPVKRKYKMIYVNENGNWQILHTNRLGFGLED
ncbi:putative uncharacterized protein [Waddlia chondrophila 2032/99]|uniref:SnoaL-like domain-containing protein n=2 Tax=Waddlia chondrophila TaxID=71667 RepID=D6YSL3_WADCW|nr:nuclear transport factor 2 family protein [Waddlia chondrophila]ADI39058.1 hypothetical protein wcw_1714 [Waddlia chondrophila WSU 86-1044]CCB92170.1 putative uncharacterized protein [Waddlia chondrophila 2032/99]